MYIPFAHLTLVKEYARIYGLSVTTYENVGKYFYVQMHCVGKVALQAHSALYAIYRLLDGYAVTLLK